MDSSAQPALTGRILLVDDDPAIRVAYARILTSAGHQVTVADDGTSAAAKLEEPFDAVVSDIWMPGLSGMELLKRIRQHDLDVPVILITGSPELGSAVAAVEYGAMTYLQKPVPLRQLVDTVQKALRLHQAARLQRQAAAWFQGSAAALSDRAGLDARFELALEKLWMAQQPIVRWSQKTVFARECLMRSDEATLAGPGAILEAAERLGRVHAVGRRVRERAAALFAGPDVPFLFVNLHPSDLLDDGLYAPTAPLTAFSRRVYLEVTERAALEGISDLRVRVERLRSLGYSIALDDLGAGYAGLNSLAHLEPELVKLDMVLVRNIDQKPTQRKLVSSMVSLCRDMRTDVIAEGVETAAERDVLVDLGCDLLQGYLFAKPARTAPAVTW